MAFNLNNAARYFVLMDFIKGFAEPFGWVKPPSEPLPYILAQHEEMKNSLKPFLSLFSLGEKVVA